MALTKVTGELVDIGDLDISNVGSIQLDSIAGDADSNTSITFSGSDVITIATGGSGRLTIGDGALSPVTDNQIDLGTSSLEFKDAFFDGTVTADAFAGPITGDLTGTLQTAAQTNITSLGTLTTLTVDDITINGSTISDAGSLTVDIGGTLILDADDGDVQLKDGGTQFASLYKSSNDFIVRSMISDGDFKIQGNDGGSTINALTLDMSDAGTATFNSGVVLGDSLAGNGAPFTISNTNNGNNIDIKTTSSNSLVHAVKIHSGGVFEAKQGAVFNEDSNDVDFRVESNGNANMLFVDGGNDKVGIGTASPSTPLHIKGAGDAYVTIEAGSADGNVGLLFDNSSSTQKGALLYDTDDNYLLFNVNDAERMRIDSSGRVGIGEATPEFPLEIGITSSTSQQVGFEITQATTGNDGRMRFKNSADSTYCRVGMESTGTFFVEPYSGSAYVKRFAVKNDGTVGIGTTSPSDLLHVMETNAAAQIRIQRHEVDGILDDNDEIGALEFWTNDDTYASGASALRAKIMAEVQNTSSGTNLQFWTGNSTSAAAERIRIQADGKVGIGTDSPA